MLTDAVVVSALLVCDLTCVSGIWPVKSDSDESNHTTASVASLLVCFRRM